MEEIIKIYDPRQTNLVGKEREDYMNRIYDQMTNMSTKSSNEKKPEKQKTKLDLLGDVITDQILREQTLRKKYPWFDILFNWLMVGMCVMLAVSLVIWGLDIRTDRKAESMFATAMADYQAEQKAVEDARQAELDRIAKSEETIVKRMSEHVAKLFYGIRRFDERYSYSEKDFETYARCVFNRVENGKYPNTLEEVVKQEGQWVGYNDSNPVLLQYYNMAEKFVKAWRSETTKPVSDDYVWAELTEKGVFLRNQYEADGYLQRWRAN